MMVRPPTHVTFQELDDATRRLVRVAAAAAASDERTVRDVLTAALEHVSPLWVEEVLLQTYLFAGFPRALNAIREWRRVSGRAAPVADASTFDGDRWRAEGEATCAAVYGPMYDRLRENIRALHPDLDSWMVVEGYGKVLSRPGLDLQRRELCIVAACAASGQDRQLHSHLHGALNVGVAKGVVEAALEALRGLMSAALVDGALGVFARVAGA
jgi:4-carboxymuconolactone decarboxylase